MLIENKKIIDELEEVLGLVCEMKGALIESCFPGRDCRSITETEISQWSSLKNSEDAKKRLMTLISELRGY